MLFHRCQAEKGKQSPIETGLVMEMVMRATVWVYWMIVMG